MLLVLFGQNLVFDFANQQAVRLISKLNFSLKISALILQLIFQKWYNSPPVEVLAFFSRKRFLDETVCGAEGSKGVPLPFEGVADDACPTWSVRGFGGDEVGELLVFVPQRSFFKDAMQGSAGKTGSKVTPIGSCHGTDVMVGTGGMKRHSQFKHLISNGINSCKSAWRPRFNHDKEVLRESVSVCNDC